MPEKNSGAKVLFSVASTAPKSEHKKMCESGVLGPGVWRSSDGKPMGNHGGRVKY